MEQKAEESVLEEEFFEEETKGIKIRPEVILILAGLLIALTIVMNKFLA